MNRIFKLAAIFMLAVPLLLQVLRIDLFISILMFVPACFILAGCHVRYISEKGDYILLNRNGFLSTPFVQLGVKSGFFIKSLNYFPVEYWNISNDDWDIDDTTGCFWLTSSRNNDRQLYVVPLDSCKYKINETVINSVRRAYDNQGAVGLCVGTFVVPERGFSRWLAVGFGKKKEVAL